MSDENEPMVTITNREYLALKELEAKFSWLYPTRDLRTELMSDNKLTAGCSDGMTRMQLCNRSAARVHIAIDGNLSARAGLEYAAKRIEETLREFDEQVARKGLPCLGNFGRKLSELYATADESNRARIRKAFAPEWERAEDHAFRKAP